MPRLLLPGVSAATLLEPLTDTLRSEVGVELKVTVRVKGNEQQQVRWQTRQYTPTMQRPPNAARLTSAMGGLVLALSLGWCSSRFCARHFPAAADWVSVDSRATATAQQVASQLRPQYCCCCGAVAAAE